MKQELKNAGFKEEKREHWDDYYYFLETNREHEAKYTVAVNVIDKRYCVQRIASTIIRASFEDLPQLSKLIFAFTRKDLDFEKKSYAWEDCISSKGWVVDSFAEVREYTNLKNEPSNSHLQNICLTESQALSVQATPQLFQIVAKINEDFEIEEKRFRTYVVQNGQGLLYVISSTQKQNQFPLNSNDAGVELIRTNTPLLLQYFETIKK